MEFIAIVFLCIIAAIVYGIIHDQITVRICVEYFTVGHPPVFDAKYPPTLLALGWGIVATWWVGLTLGVLVAFASRAGTRPKLAATDLVRPLSIMLAIVGLFAASAGTVGYLLTTHNYIRLLEPLASRVSPDQQVAFLTALWAHNASYLGGFIGAILFCRWIFKVRRQFAAHTQRS